MKLYPLYIALILFNSVSAMMIDEKQAKESFEKRRDRFILRKFMTLKAAKDLQTKLGTELIKESEIGKIFAGIPKVQKQEFNIYEFKTTDEKIWMHYANFETPTINHAGTHIVLPVNSKQTGWSLYIVHLKNKKIDQRFLVQSKEPNFSKIEWSADDHFIALHIGQEIIIYDLSTSKFLHLFTVYDSFCWHPKKSAQIILFNAESSTIEMVDIVKNESEQIKIPYKLQKISMDCSPDGKFLAFASKDGIGIFNLLTHSFEILENSKDGNFFEWSPDSAYIALGSYNENVVKIWNIKTNTLDQISLIPGSLQSMTWTQDNKLQGILDQGFTAGHYYVQILIDPLQKSCSNRDSQIILDLIQQENSQDWLKNPFYDKRNNSLGHFLGGDVEISHKGKFLVNTRHDQIFVDDYSQQQEAEEYLRSKIPLSNAVMLLYIFKSVLSTEKISLDSTKIQNAFDTLPDYLRLPLEQWIKKHSKPKLKDKLYSVFERLHLK